MLRATSILNLYCALAALLMFNASLRRGKTSSMPSKINVRMLGLTLLMLLCDGIAKQLYLHTSTVLVTLTAISYMAYYGVMSLYTRYITELIRPRCTISYSYTVINAVICILGCLLWIANCAQPLYFDIRTSTVIRPVLYLLSQFPGVFFLIINGIMLLRYHTYLGRTDTILLAILPVIPTCSWILTLIVPGLNVRYAAVLLMLTEYELQINTKMDRQLALTEQEAELLRHKIELERVKPHFIYNALSVIYYLCDSDPQLAKQALESFSGYLRKALELLDQKDLVDFDWELKLTQDYLALEKLRFGDRFNIEYDIQTEDFFLPPFTLQMIAENAMKHGLSQRQSGGILRISSREEPNGVSITVTDNGTGFQPDQKLSETSHTGIRTTQQRLASLCNGTLTIHSEPGEGASVRIYLPGHRVVG